MKGNKSILALGLMLLITAITIFILTACHTTVILSVKYSVDGEIVHTTNTDGRVITFPEKPEKEGYEFDGWYFDDGTFAHRFTISGDGASFLTRNTTVYANWKKIASEYSVTFLDYDDALLDEQIIQGGEDAIAPAVDAREGYDFAGWSASYNNVNADLIIRAQYVAKKYDVTFVNPDDSVIAVLKVTHGDTATLPIFTPPAGYEVDRWEGSLSDIRQDTTIKAVFRIKILTITLLDYNDSVLHTENVNYGENLKTTPTPHREGYDFIGFSGPLTEISESAVYYAEYSPIILDVTFFGLGGEVIEAYQVAYGGDAVAPDYDAPEGYEFFGWDNSFDNITDDTEINALLSRIELTVIFKDLEDNILSEETIYYGDSVICPTAPEIEGYDFTGWSECVDIIKEDLTIWTVYSIKVLTIRVYGFDNVLIEEHFIEYGKDATLSVAPDVVGYTFVEWTGNFTNVEQDEDIYAEYIINTYSVTFIDHDLSETIINVTHGSSATPPAPKNNKTGYEFVNWDGELTNIIAHKTIYAQYAVRNYNLSVYFNDGRPVTTLRIAYEGRITLPTPIRKGYSFIGWYGDDGFEELFTETNMPANNIHIYALWSDPVVYTVTYNLDDGINGENPEEYTVEDVYPLNNASKTGYTFIRWEDASGSAISTIQDMAANLVLNAVFTINYYSVTFINDGATYNEQSIAYMNDAIDPEDPEKPRTAQYTYIFTGWDKAYTNIINDITITAIYTAELNFYDVIFMNDGQVYNSQSIGYSYSALPPIGTPQKAADAEYTYVFNGWIGSFVNIVGETIITAGYNNILNYYTVTFINDGEVFDTQSIGYGYAATTPYGTPERTADAQFTYEFSEWDSDYNFIVGDTIIAALYNNILNYYTVTFINDGEVFDTQSIGYGHAAITPIVAPEKTADAQYTYVFNGWAGDYSIIIEAITITAIYNNILNYYTVTFINDGEVFDTQSIGYGHAGTIPIATPEKAADAQYTYVFNGWIGDYNCIVEDTTITASYNNILNYYTVTFINDGEVYDTQSIGYGYAAITPDGTPERTADAQYTYEFNGWIGNYNCIVEDTTITASYTNILNYYTVTFINDSEVYDTQSIGYGYAATTPDGTPEKAADAQFTYDFNGWIGDYNYIVEDTTITASYNNILNYYDVRFFDYDSTQLGVTQSIGYGSAAIAPPEPDNKEGWHFVEWDEDYTYIVGTLNVYAIYESNIYEVVFIDWDDTELSRQDVEYLSAAELPTDPDRGEWYTFTGWSEDTSSVTSNMAVYALYQVHQHTVLFLDYNDAVLKSAQVDRWTDATPPANPDNKEGWHFVEWDGDYNYVLDDLTVKAIYAINVYEVVFLDWDDTELSRQYIEHGSDATAPADPEKTADAQYTYVFSSWSESYIEVTQALIIVALYDNILNYYEVRFFDYDDTQLGETQSIGYGAAATAPANPDNKEGWHFVEWDEEFSFIIGVLDVYAIYQINIYTVTFMNGANVHNEQQIAHGAAATTPTDPTKASTAEYHFTFNSWSADFANIVADMVIHAVYDNELRYYTVIFINDGALFDEQTVAYGAAANEPAATPQKPSTIQYIYTYDGWDNAFSYIVGNLTVTATYIQSLRPYEVSFYDNNNTFIETRSILYSSSLVYSSFPTLSLPSTQQTVAWRYGEESEYIFNNITVNENYIVSEATIRLTAMVWGKNVKYGSTTYATMDAALAAIQSYSSGTLLLTGDMFFLSQSTASYNIPSGVSMRLPYNAAGGLTEYGARGVNECTVNVAGADKTYLTLTVPSNITFNVYGTIEIGGIIGNEGGVRQGHTSSWHSVLILDGTINVRSGGTLNTYGFVRGTGLVETFSGGKVYEPFVVSDFRGGASTGGSYRSGDISPFNRYQLENIQTTFKVRYGAIHYGYPVLYADSQYNAAGATQMTGASGLIRLLSGGYLVREYEADAGDNNTGKLTLTIVGGATDGSLKMSIKINFFITVNVDTANVLFPIPYNYTIIMTNGTYTMSLRYKILTGTQIVVGAGATLNLTGRAIVYESFTDITYGGAIYPNKSAGLLNILGTINITGIFGGLMRSSASGTAIIGSSATLSLTSKEGYGTYSNLSFSFHETSTRTLSAEGYIAGNRTTLAQGNTYTINGGY